LRCTDAVGRDGAGLLNHIFNGAYRVRLIGKWVKKKSHFAITRGSD
jgi:hypothetical protein